MRQAAEILLISEGRIATVRLLEQILSIVAPATGMTLRSRTMAELSPADVTPGTIPLFARVDTISAHRLAVLLHGLGIDYWYYLDDNFWESSLDTEVGRYYRHPDVRARLDELLGNAQRLLVATPALRDYLGEKGMKATLVDPFFDFSLVPHLPPPPAVRSIVRAGFASGSDRSIDILPVIPDVLAALDRHPDFEFELIGTDYPSIPDHPRFHRHPVQPDYESYLRFQLDRDWDFAIAPLSGDRFNLYKTDNKYREYAALGIPGVYQDSAPYAAVVDGATGLKVGEGLRSWSEAMDLYIARPDVRLAVRTAARADVERRQSVDAVKQIWIHEIRSGPRIGRADRPLRRALDLPSDVPADAVLATVRPRGPLTLPRRTIRSISRRLRTLPRSGRGDQPL